MPRHDPGQSRLVQEEPLMTGTMVCLFATVTALFVGRSAAVAGRRPQNIILFDGTEHYAIMWANVSAVVSPWGAS
jgi:hypothetical protein